MDDIMHEKLNIGPTLNFNEKLYRQSLNKKFGTQTHKQIYDLQCLEKINSVAFLYMKLLMENLCGGVKKIVLSQNKRPYNLETFKCNREKFGTQPET